MINRVLIVYLLLGVGLPYAVQRWALGPLAATLHEQDQFIERLNNH